MTGGAQGTIIQRIDRMQATAAMLWITFGGALFYFGWHLATFNRRGGPGPGFFLKGLAALLLFLAMVRLVTGAVLKERSEPVSRVGSPSTGSASAMSL